MKAIDNLFRVGKAFPGDSVHGAGHVKSNLQHPVAGLTGELPQDTGYLHGLYTLDDGNQGTLATVTVLVRDDRVQLATGERTLVDTQARAQVPREEQPLVSVGAWFPRRVIA